MAAVKMFIDKFDGEVLIDYDHPLAVAQREKDAGGEPVTKDAGDVPPEVPEGYTLEQSGQWWKLIDPDGEQVGKSQRTREDAVALVPGSAE